ncbi:MAG: hypothetical protein ACKJSG_05335 [Lentisphaeria bacterium]
MARLTTVNIPVRRDVCEKMLPQGRLMTKHQLSWNTDFLDDIIENQPHYRARN